jgi:DNA repair exonuclease SbcCD nuclease subunit
MTKDVMPHGPALLERPTVETVTLVHSSDLHVDDDIRPGHYNGLLGLRAVLATAAALDADIVLLAGDTFDNARIAQSVLQEAAAILSGAAMPVVILPGNHDPATTDCIYRRAGIAGLEQVRVLGVTNPDTVDFPGLELQICGRAHRDHANMSPLMESWPRRARRYVVIAHGHYVPSAEWATQAHRAWKISDADLANSGADYVALGHWDRPTPVGDGCVPAFYSGSPDLAGTVNVVALPAQGCAHVRRAPLLWPE